MGRVSIRDIAAETGYSPATVSNVLNEKGNVGAKATGIVLEAVKRLGYRRVSQLDRVIFAVGRVNGRIVDESPFHAGVYAGIERAAKRLGLAPSMVTLDLSNPRSRKKNIEELERASTAGVVLLASEMVDDEEYALFEGFELPLVIVDGWSDKMPFDCVTIANEAAAYRATALLAENGHERLGYIGSNFRIKNFPQRARGFMHVLADMWISFDEKNRIFVDPSPELAVGQILDWLNSRPREELPTGIFCDNDPIAASLIQALNQSGLRVPDDVSVMGFGDERLCQLVQPPLSSVHVPRHEMGEMAVRRLMEQTTDPHHASCVTMLHTNIVSRASIKRL